MRSENVAGLRGDVTAENTKITHESSHLVDKRLIEVACRVRTNPLAYPEIRRFLK